MQIGIFAPPVHRPEKPYGQMLAEDREMVILADRLGYDEVWIGEHFTSVVEGVTSPMMFLATVIGETSRIRLGTGVVNLPHHHPGIVAAEAAMFDHLSGGRLMLGVGAGSFAPDLEFFGKVDVARRNATMLAYIEAMQRLWATDAPFDFEAAGLRMSVTDTHWPRHALGIVPKPVQRPHPPLALALGSAASVSAAICAERDFIPISNNNITEADVIRQWDAYAAARRAAGKPVDRSVWRIARNILVTETDAEAEAVTSDPDGDLAFFYRFLRSLRHIADLDDMRDEPTDALDARVGVPQMIANCAIAGSPKTVLDRLIDFADRAGPFGVLLAVAHDWEATGRWQASMRRLAEDVAPKLSQHMTTLAAAAAE